MDIICGKCGKHFSSIENARWHRGNCKEVSKGESIHFEPAPKSTITPEEWERIMRSINPQDALPPKAPTDIEPTAVESESSKDSSESATERLIRLKKEAHRDYISVCPKCSHKSLWHNVKEGKYECLKLNCMAVMSSPDKTTERIKRPPASKYRESDGTIHHSNYIDSEVITRSKTKNDDRKRDKKAYSLGIQNWLVATVLIFALCIIGIGVSIFARSSIPFWLLFGFSFIFSIEKWFYHLIRKYKRIGKLYRLLLNLSILSLLGLLVWSGIKLFSQQNFHSPQVDTLIFLAEFAFFVWIWRVVARNSWRWPSMKLTIFSLLVITIICAFAGVQPLSTYKDTLLSNFNNPTAAVPENIPVTSIPEEPIVLLSEDIERAIFNSINELRKDKGISTLSWNDSWHEEAKRHSEYKANPTEYKSSSFSNYENIFHLIAYSEDDVPINAIRSWIEGEERANNLLDHDVVQGGVGVTVKGNYYYVSLIAITEAPVVQELEIEQVSLEPSEIERP